MPMMLLTVEASEEKNKEAAAINTACQMFQEEYPEEVPVPISCRLLSATLATARFLVTVV
jgi:hypothetical protein